MLDNLGGVATFRCGGCGRALKVPAQFRQGPNTRPTEPRAESPAERTQALPKLPPVASVPPTASVPPVTPAPVNPAAVAAAAAAGAGALPPGSGLPPKPRPVTPESLQPPLILRLVLWAIALPLGSLIVFTFARWFGVLTKAQLEDTILLTGWGRFVPVARLLPFCALATAVIVQLGVFGLERLRARNLRRPRPPRRRPGQDPGSGPRRPMRPPGQGQGQRTTNGARSRDRVIS
jgi:hypothetical protein